MIEAASTPTQKDVREPKDEVGDINTNPVSSATALALERHLVATPTANIKVAAIDQRTSAFSDVLFLAWERYASQPGASFSKPWL